MTNMDPPPATYYGKLDKRNPVLSTFNRDITLFFKQMKIATSSINRDNSFQQAKGVKHLLEIWQKYKHRLPDKLYQERMLQIADFLYEIKLYQMALWYGYSPYLLQFSSVKVTEITDVDHFVACFFPEGFHTDQDSAVKVHAMLGCAKCIFEEEKKCSTLSERRVCELLRVLNFIRSMMQAFQQHEHLPCLIYDGSSLIYNICRYLMSMKCSEQALEYLLWASISLELCVPLMTAKHLPLIVTLYCAVCYCYLDNQAEEQAEDFAKRALGKMNELATLEYLNEAAGTTETQGAFKEASTKLGALIFKRAVFDKKRRTQITQRLNFKTTLKDLPGGPWPRTSTEHMLINQFDCRAGQVLGILEALWDSNTQPLQRKMPDDAELTKVVLELLSAGMRILSGVTSTSEQRCPNYSSLSPDILTPTKTLMDLVITGEDKIPVMSAVRFIKLLFQYKQSEAFAEFVKEMLHFLSGLKGHPFRMAQLELTLLHSVNNLLLAQETVPKKTNIKHVSTDGHKSFLMSNELTELVNTMHESVCGSAPKLQPDQDLVLQVVFFLWEKLKVFTKTDQLDAWEFTHELQTKDNQDKWVWCVSELCEVALACELPIADCILVAEMIWTVGKQLERTADETQMSACERPGNVQLSSSVFKSKTELLKKVCKLVAKGLEALAKAASTLYPQDSSAVTDSAFMQKFAPLDQLSASSVLSKEETGAAEVSMQKEEAKKAEEESDFKSYECSQSVKFLQTRDLHLELNIVLHKVSLKLLQLNQVAEPDLLDRIKKNNVSKAHFLIQKALLEYSIGEPNERSRILPFLEEAFLLIKKAEMEEKKLYMTTHKAQKEAESRPGKDKSPPPPPTLICRTDHCLTFAPASYNLEGQVSWYQLCGRVAEGVNLKVRLGDHSIPGTGIMVPVVSGECILKVEGLQPNQKYVFAVAAFNNKAELLGKAIGETTAPVLAAMPVPLLPTWAHLAQVAFQTEQYTIAKKACSKLWSHYTDSNSTSNSSQDRFAATRLHMATLKHSSHHLCQLFLTSIFIETEINIQQKSLYSFSSSGKFAGEQKARLAECERMMVVIDMAICLNDGKTAVQAVVNCYRLLAPLMFHQLVCDPVVQVLKKCLVVLEVNSFLLKHKWTGSISESLVHMVASITYYLSKVLRVLKKNEMAAAVMDCGRRLLQDIHDAHLEMGRISKKAEARKSAAPVADGSHMKINLQLKALHRMDEKNTTSEPAVDTDSKFFISSIDKMTKLYDLISSSPLQEAFQTVKNLKQEIYFLEFAALLIQRTMEEGHLNLTLKWGETMFKLLSRRDKKICLEGNNKSNKEDCPLTPKENDEKLQNTNLPSIDETRRTLKWKLPRSLILCVRTNREVRTVDQLLTMMSYVVQRNKRKIHLRNLYSEESVWKSYINCCVAQSHLALLFQDLDQMLEGSTQQRYSQFDPFWFSLAHSGVLMKRTSQPQSSSECNAALGEASCDSKQREDQKKVVRSDDSKTEESYKKEEQTVEEQMETQRFDSASRLDSVQKAALCLRRAMVLAHRGHHWTSLQHVCQIVWDQNHRITTAVQRAAQSETPPPVSSNQLSTLFTPLLVLAADLIMDMMSKLQLWSLYDGDLTAEELESSLHYSASIDDITQVDLRWVRTLVLHTLELLHYGGKWESLAHFALLFNSYTRERYSLIITPLLVNAQRKLLERISSLEGPEVPQPHHVKTQKHTGKEINCRSYAGCQLLSGWTPHSAKKAAQASPTHKHAKSLKESEKQLSMMLVCVPLDVDYTLTCYRQVLKKTPQCLQVFQQSNLLLMQFLAHTQPCFAVQLLRCQSRGLTCEASQVSSSPAISRMPNSLPSLHEDFSVPDATYSCPISPDYISIVAAALSDSSQCLKGNGHESLRVLTLHEMGNLQVYNGNICAAHSSWSKAVDCIFQSTGVAEKWDGVSFTCDSLQKTVKQAGVWGCLQAAVLTAKIAQYIFTSDISQKTKSCLLSAHLFKCVLCCTAQPQSDLQYASHSIEDELLPGVDLFAEPRRLNFGATVASLNFICHWLFSAGYYVTLLPTLTLYVYLVAHVGRDVRRTVEGKILKVRTLTELCLFTEAITETVQLTQGTGVILPSGHLVNTNPQPVKTFHSNQPLQDNLEGLENLVSCDFTPRVCSLYGSTLCIKISLARDQLILALANSVHGHPESVNSEHLGEDKLDEEDSCEKSEELIQETMSPENMKVFLLKVASSLLSSVMHQLKTHSCTNAEKLELTLESRLLKANLHLQERNVVLSAKVAFSNLKLLQTSPVLEEELEADCPIAVEARERISVYMWLRCRLTLAQILVGNIHEVAGLLPGKNMNEEAALVVQDGLDECVKWGDSDFQALLMLEGAELEAKRGRTDDSLPMLQRVVSLLTGRTHMPPGSFVTLARAVLLISDLRGAQSITLLQLTQKLLKQQLCVFNQTVTSVDGRILPPESINIYLPYFDLLNKINLKIDSTLKPGNKGRPVSGGSSQSTSRRSVNQQSQTGLKSSTTSSSK